MPVPIQKPATFSDAMAIAIANGHIKNAYEIAKVYDRVMESGDVEKIRSLDFPAELMCVQCQRPPLDTKTGKEKSLWCSGCKAVIYCSRDCQLKDWKTGHPSHKKPHKESCPAFKTQMGRVPQFQRVDSQFPWLRSESDGVFLADLLKARLSLLGSGSSYGWWSVRYEEQPHDHGEAELHKLRTSPGMAAALFEPSTRTRPATTIKRPVPGAYMHGEIMLGESWPTDVEGWKIKEEWVPKLFFDEKASPPKAPLPGQVKDWKSWYEWRGLSMESPAALLMDYPLSVYHLLVNVLKVVEPARLNERRSELVVHYLGAEIELNFLPLFSELALLLPNVHITLVIFGQPAHDLVHSAKEYHPSSIAAQDIVWSYKAPKLSGGGSIDIKLSSETVLWSRHIVIRDDQPKVPHAVVACNAGLSTYATWDEVIRMTGMLNIPFAVTDYAEHILNVAVQNLQTLLSDQAAECRSFMPLEAALLDQSKKRSRPVTINPFHRPGKRCIPMYRVPNYYNGFVVVVNGGH